MEYYEIEIQGSTQSLAPKLNQKHKPTNNVLHELGVVWFKIPKKGKWNAKFIRKKEDVDMNAHNNC